MAPARSLSQLFHHYWQVSGSHDFSLRLWGRTQEPLVLSEERENVSWCTSASIPSHPHMHQPSHPHIPTPYILTSHPHTLTFPHASALTSSHLHMHQPSHPHIPTPHILTSHPHTLTSPHPHIPTCISPHILTSHTLTSSHYILTPSHSHMHQPSHPHIPTCISTHILTPLSPHFYSRRERLCLKRQWRRAVRKW